MEENKTWHNRQTNPDQEFKLAAEDAEPSRLIVRAFYEFPAE